MTDVNSLMAIAETSPLALVLVLLGMMLILTIVAAVAGHLWTRWMGRVERRLDIVEAEQRETTRSVATRADIAGIEQRITARLDRLEIRIDHAARDPPAE